MTRTRWVGGWVGGSFSLIGNPCSHMPSPSRQSDLHPVLSSSHHPVASPTCRPAGRQNGHPLFDANSSPPPYRAVELLLPRRREPFYFFEWTLASSGCEATFSQNGTHSDHQSISVTGSESCSPWISSVFGNGARTSQFGNTKLSLSSSGGGAPPPLSQNRGPFHYPLTRVNCCQQLDLVKLAVTSTVYEATLWKRTRIKMEPFRLFMAEDGFRNVVRGARCYRWNCF